MKILVVGSEGFLGRHLMEQGESMGHDVRGCDVVGDPMIRARAEYLDDRHLKGIERVIYSAGVLGTSETLANPIQAVGQNVSAVIKVLELCRQHGVSFTYLTLGNNWLNPYSITKNCAADFVRMYHVVHGLSTQVAVCYNVFGPYQKWKPVRKIVPEFMTRLLRGEPVELFNNGEQNVDMCYAPDVARAILDNTHGMTQHYGSGKEMKVATVAQLCANALGVELETKDLGPRPGETGEAAIAPYPMPNQTRMDEALRITAEWYQENYSARMKAAA